MSTITSAWSSYGHRFMSDGEDDGAGGSYESCLTCGALYVLRAVDGDPSRGEYQTNDGSEPMECPRDTGMAHGYPGERHCHEHQHPRDYSDHECSHVSHACNCIQCNS